MTQSKRSRARLGLLVPFTNTNLEPDMALMCPKDVLLYVARMGGYDADEIPDEHQMAGLGNADLAEPLGLLLGAKPDLVIYGCTSATLAHGVAFDRDLAATIAQKSGAQTVTAAGALLHAAKALGVSRLGFASPYVPSLNDRAIAFLNSEGLACVSRADVDGALGNDGQGALTPEDVIALAQKADSTEAEAIILSCTDMRAVEAIERIEDILGKPVITSNQAMLYQALQMLGINDALDGFGQLLRLPRL